MDLTEEAISEFAQHLIPEAFTTASSAARVELQPAHRSEWLGHWVSSCVRDAVAARDLEGAPLPGVIFVQRGDERWRWDLPHPIWPLEALVDTVRRELDDFSEPRVFVAALQDRQRQQLCAVMVGDDTEPSWMFPWYAEERSRQRAAVMTGDVEVAGSRRRGAPPVRERREVQRAGRCLLTGHPSRRRYRLR